MEFGEAFAPAIGPKTFKLVLALAAQHILHLEQSEKKSTFLDAKIDEEVFRKQSESFAKTAQDGTEPVCNLNISIYGLKQDSRNWYERLKTFLLYESFLQNKSDPYLYVKREDISLA